MAKLIYLAHYRPQETDISPKIGCVGLVRPYVVNSSVAPAPIRNERDEQLMREFEESQKQK